MDIHEMFDKIEIQINKKIEFAEDFRYRYGLQEAMATVKDVMNEYEYKNKVDNQTEGTIQITRKDDFFEKYPYACRRKNGTPSVCAYLLDYVHLKSQCLHLDNYGNCDFDSEYTACMQCWSEPLSEEGDK